MTKIIPLKILVLLGIAIVVAILVTLVSLRAPQTQTPEIPSAFPATSSSPGFAAIQISPSTSTILEPNSNPTFILSLLDNTNPNSLSVKLIKQSIDTPQLSEVAIQTLVVNRSIQISLTETIQPSTNYILTVTDRPTNQQIGTFAYISDVEPRTKETQNNTNLVQYLPHRTESYDLVYLEERNLYVFSFSYNPNQNTSVESQYEAARQNALRFIRSKNIDPESLKIEWRYH